MSDEERITVGAVSAGDGGSVDLPVVELLTGRGFVTGKSGSGKSNSASVVAEKLLDGGYGLLIVDIDGEYYGLKEEYEILHAGADEECDIQVGPQHAEKIAQLALEKHVPIILDVSSFLDESEANELLREVARHLFAKEKKLKQPFLLVVEEVHEYLPEGGGLDECGRMLIKVAKRGRKHGLGLCGISQRPADVKKDFITQCDWLVWHRLTWQNDTKVVKRILGSDYADGVEELNDGEGYLMTDWDEDVRRVQFQRKRTFDAGATPGLDDFERPELKSVSDDLVSDLERISEEQQARESRVKELERQLKDRELRIEELEAELEEARDLSEMAEQFSRAMMAHATGRPFREDVTGYQASLEESSRASAPGERRRVVPDAGEREATTETAGPVPDLPESDARERSASESDTEAGDAGSGDGDDEDRAPPDEHARPRPEPDGSMTGGEGEGFEPAYEPWPDEDDFLSPDGTGNVDAVVDESTGGSADEAMPGEAGTTGRAGPNAEGGEVDGRAGTAEADGGADILVPADESETDTGPDDWNGSFDGASGSGEIIVPGETGDDSAGDRTGDTGNADRETTGDAGADPEDSGGDIIVHGEDSGTTPDGDAGAATDDEGNDPDDAEGTATEDSTGPDGADTTRRAERGGSTDHDPGASFAERGDSDFERPVVSEVRETVESFDPVVRGMLAYYRAEGPASPVDAQVAAGGDGDRTRAYGRNSRLREAGLVAHAGRGRYAYALRTRIDEAHDGRLGPEALDAAVERVEAAFLDRSDAPWPGV